MVCELVTYEGGKFIRLREIDRPKFVCFIDYICLDIGNNLYVN